MRPGSRAQCWNDCWLFRKHRDLKNVPAKRFYLRFALVYYPHTRLHSIRSPVWFPELVGKNSQNIPTLFYSLFLVSFEWQGSVSWRNSSTQTHNWLFRYQSMVFSGYSWVVFSYFHSSDGIYTYQGIDMLCHRQWRLS